MTSTHSTMELPMWVSQDLLMSSSKAGNGPALGRLQLNQRLVLCMRNEQVVGGHDAEWVVIISKVVIVRLLLRLVLPLRLRPLLL